MSVLEDFDRARAIVLQHLPRPVRDGLVTITPDSVTLAAPGVSLGDLARLLSDLGAPTDTLPEAVSLDALHLRHLHLARDPFGEEISLAFSVALGGAQPIEIVPDVTLDLAQVDFLWQDGHFSAHSTLDLHIHGHSVTATLDLPAQMVNATIEGPTASALLQSRGLAHENAHLRRLYFSAHIPLRRALLYVALEDVARIGPARLSVIEGELALADDMEDVAGQIHAQVVLEIDNHDAVTFDVDAQMDAQGWRLAGAVGFDHDFAPKLSGLVASAARAMQVPAPPMPRMFGQLLIQHLSMSMDTHAQSFEAEMALEWHGEGELTLTLRAKDGDLHVQGAFHVGDTVLSIDFDRHHGDNLIAIDWHARGGQQLDIGRILEAMNIDTGGLPTQSIAVTATSLGLVLDAAGNALMAAEIDAGIDLSRLGDLPVLGTLMPKDLELGLSLNPYYLSSDFKDSARPARPGAPAWHRPPKRRCPELERDRQTPGTRAFPPGRLQAGPRRGRVADAGAGR